MTFEGKTYKEFPPLHNLKVVPWNHNEDLLSSGTLQIDVISSVPTVTEMKK